MKINKKLVGSFLTVCFATLATGCSDFFDPQTDDTLSSDDYIQSQTEVYTGYLGIMTKLQEVADQRVFLTETRGELLEPTVNCTPELQALYNYDADLSGNSYADPSGYYELVIACNDYLANMLAFKKEKPELVEEDRFNQLISMTVRMKVWTYLTIAEIYGQALWFDDPMLQIQDLTDASKFQLKNIDEVVDACLDLLQNGSAASGGMNGEQDFSWYEWLDPETALANSDYRYWDNMTPPYVGLLAKLSLWKGSALQGNGKYEEAKTYYQQVTDLMLTALQDVYCESGNIYYWQRTAAIPGNYARNWDNADPYAREVVCAVMYDYTRHQTNRLLKHFSSEYPNEYLLRPNLDTHAYFFFDESFNPGGTNVSTRANCVCGSRNNNKHYLAKYRPINSSRRVNAFQDDVHIYLFRATEYHFFLAEALNCLGRFTAASAIINDGIKVDYFEKDLDGNMIKGEDGYGTPIAGFEGFTNDWTKEASFGTLKYPSMGVRGCLSLGNREFKTEPQTTSQVMEYMKFNDNAILDERILEFAGEGLNYPALIRSAKRWGTGGGYDASFVTNRVCLKYQFAGQDALAAEVKTKIEAGGYFVPWNLNLNQE